MGERRGTKALETWCRRVTQGYPGVKVENMTTSWRDGLAFCALIHHFRPDLIDFARLNKTDVYGNNELAFRIAERHLGIPALLDAEDMAEYPVPDRLSILTYLSQFYQAFASNSSSPVKKASPDSPDNPLMSLNNVQPQQKMGVAMSGRDACLQLQQEWSRGREPCAACDRPVYLAERVRVGGGRSYHRTCWRCAQCAAQLGLADALSPGAGESGSHWLCEDCKMAESSPLRITEEEEGTSEKPSSSSSTLRITEESPVHRIFRRCKVCRTQLGLTDSKKMEDLTCWLCEDCKVTERTPENSSASPLRRNKTCEGCQTHFEPVDTQMTRCKSCTMSAHLPRPEEPPPPPPPVSLVTARRLFFDTDDAKLLNQDNQRSTPVHTTPLRLVHKDLSPKDDDPKIKPVNTSTVDKNLSATLTETDNSLVSKNLEHIVNNITVPDSLSQPVEEPVIQYPCLSDKKVADSSAEKSLDVSVATPSFNDTLNGNEKVVSNVSSHSLSDPVEFIDDVPEDIDAKAENLAQHIDENSIDNDEKQGEIMSPSVEKPKESKEDIDVKSENLTQHINENSIENVKQGDIMSPSVEQPKESKEDIDVKSENLAQHIDDHAIENVKQGDIMSPSVEQLKESKEDIDVKSENLSQRIDDHAIESFKQGDIMSPSVEHPKESNESSTSLTEEEHLQIATKNDDDEFKSVLSSPPRTPRRKEIKNIFKTDAGNSALSITSSTTLDEATHDDTSSTKEELLTRLTLIHETGVPSPSRPPRIKSPLRSSKDTTEVSTSSSVSTPSVTPRKKPQDYPDELNPFGESDEEEDLTTVSKVSTNPFGSDSEEEEDEGEQRVPTSSADGSSLQPQMRKSTNPFGSDEEDEATPASPYRHSGGESSMETTPVPLQRNSRLRSSISSLSSLGSTFSASGGGARRRRVKRPAPLPPGGAPSPGPASSAPGPSSAPLSSASRRSSVSSLASVRSRKTKRAPLPPSPMSQPQQPQASVTHISTESSLAVESPPPLSPPLLEVTPPQDVPPESAGELLSQIEEGIQKLIAQHDSLDEPTKETELDPNENPSDVKLTESNTLNEPSNDSATEESTETCELKVEMENKSTLISTKEEKESINFSSKCETKNDSVESAHSPENISSIDENLLKSKENQEIPVSDIENERTVPVSCDENVVISDKDLGTYDEDRDEEGSSRFDTKCDKTYSLVEAVNEEMMLSTGCSASQSYSVRMDQMRPPLLHSTPLKDSTMGSLRTAESSLEDISLDAAPSPVFGKSYKDSTNLHRKISDASERSVSSSSGWSSIGRRKKGPAPGLPLPPRRRPVQPPIPVQRLRQQLADIEVKQQELERQGVALEEKIRDKFNEESNITPYVEELVLQLFELVNEKNELFRKQAELMYLRRQHQLEEEQAELEYQIRCLMSRPDANKTDTDKEMEEKLIRRLVEVVERRDAVVQCLEMDRQREEAEDRSIHRQIDTFTRGIVSDDRIKIKKKHHKKKKEKHQTLEMLDLDKDLDESEKEARKKKKWFTLHQRTTKHM